MKLLENKVVCIVLMVVLIAAGFFAGGTMKLNSLYKADVEKIFLTGEDGDGICIENDLAERANAATNLVTIASKYSGVKAEADKVTEAVARLNTASDIGQKSDANKELDTAVESLFNVLGDAGLKSSDETYAWRLYTDFNSRNDTISHDPYNTYAAEYNETISKFPASILPAKEAVIFY